jgi:hypothetical protein
LIQRSIKWRQNRSSLPLGLLPFIEVFEKT